MLRRDLHRVKSTEQRLKYYFAGAHATVPAPDITATAPTKHELRQHRSRLVQSTEPELEAAALGRTLMDGAPARHRFRGSILRDENQEQMLAKYRKDLAADNVLPSLSRSGSFPSLHRRKAFRSSRDLKQWLDDGAASRQGSRAHTLPAAEPPDLNDWQGGTLVPGVSWRRQRQVQLKALHEAMEAADVKQKVCSTGPTVENQDSEEEDVAGAEAAAGKGRASREQELLGSVDLIAAGLHDDGLAEVCPTRVRV
jgi:hypothetical protein